MLSKRRLIQNIGLLTSEAERVIETKALPESKEKTSVTLHFLQEYCAVLQLPSPHVNF